MILYTDKTELFECTVSVDGASIDNTNARLVVEGKKWNLVFYGNIENDGRCKINIGNLNIFNEGDHGKIRLEIIADDTVFVPWKDDFQVKTNKKVTVEVISNEKNNNSTLSESNRTNVSVNVQMPTIKNEESVSKIQDTVKKDFLQEISQKLKQHNITSENIAKNKQLFTKIILNNMEKFNIDGHEIGWIVEHAAALINGTSA